MRAVLGQGNLQVVFQCHSEIALAVVRQKLGVKTEPAAEPAPAETSEPPETPPKS